MRKILTILLFGAFVATASGAGPAGVQQAVAQDRSRELAGALSRLKNNPRYQGRILGTHVKRSGGRILYEVRILRPDDRIILVYIDPDTGGVVGDSGRGNRNRLVRPDDDREIRPPPPPRFDRRLRDRRNDRINRNDRNRRHRN